jgi:hypothetical protein
MSVPLDIANLPSNFNAPPLRKWWSVWDIDQTVQECAMLARNASDVASMAVTLVRKNPHTFAQDEALALQSGVRLHRLLYYFREVCRWGLSRLELNFGK